MAVLKMFVQFCDRRRNVLAVEVSPMFFASCEIAKSAIEYSSVSDAPLSIGDRELSCVFGTYPSDW
ncbi:MAG TPA: hypothetical protein VGG75_01970 [Trebonia sp.]